ncbi:MAG TPA: hypothetical protein VG866_01765 [Candidatus Paceibacterota bacterium]|nr:hypothetical protein [Candidatus Paceibacterota bacterium]
MKLYPRIALFILAIAGFSVFVAPAAHAQIKYQGFYFVEDDMYNIHYMDELAGYNNVLKISIDNTKNPQAIATKARQDGYTYVEITLGFNEALFTNADGARDAYLQNVKKKLYQDSDLGNMLLDIHILEEEFTLLHQHYFDDWAFVKNLDVAACQAKYHDPTLNARNCEDYAMKEGLESYISDVKKYFPGIPTIIVENTWGYNFEPPSNLDILGIDAYYIPSTADCGENQQTLFRVYVTDVVNYAKRYGKPIYMVGAVFNSGPYKMPSQCQAQWYIDYAKNTPEVIGLNWFLYATVDGVNGVRNDPLVTFLKQEGRKLFNSTPVITSTAINASQIIPNAQNTYQISVTASDKDGADDIKAQYALVNQLYQGVNGGQYRGYVGWSKDGDSVQKYYFPGISGAVIPCLGGGTAAKAVGYGEEYMNLLSCSTSVSSTTRTTVFTVSFNLNFTAPTANNTVSGWATDEALARSGWQTFGSFGLKSNSAPIITNTAINTSTIAPNMNTPYQISISASDKDGVNDIKVEYALINQLYQGPNGGQYRGYLGWSQNNDAVEKYYFPGVSGSVMPCAGGGYAAKAVAYGAEYMNLISCSTSTSGTTRTTVFTVTFNTNFTAPTANNTVSGWATDEALARSGWQTFQTFGLVRNTSPMVVNAAINASRIVPNGQNTYQITVASSDTDGPNDIKAQYALVNQLYQGVNGGQYRGYVGWSKDGDMVQNYYFPGIQGATFPCTGGGVAAKAIGYGQEYLNVLGCSTSVSGNTRTTVFTVSFNPNFTAPATGNTISGWATDAYLARSGWQTFGTFGL